MATQWNQVLLIAAAAAKHYMPRCVTLGYISALFPCSDFITLVLVVTVTH